MALAASSSSSSPLTCVNGRKAVVSPNLWPVLVLSMFEDAAASLMLEPVLEPPGFEGSAERRALAMRAYPLFERPSFSLITSTLRFTIAVVSFD
jgi:hypothetical protein